MKRIWFVSHYSMPPKYEMRIKTQMYAHYLNELGYDTKIFSASTIHNTDINLIKDKRTYITCQYDDLNFVHIKCQDYHNNGFKRIRNMLEFGRKFKRVALKFPLPDVIVADVNCINYAHIYQFCNKHRIKFYIDVRDLWPMSIVEYYHISEKNPLIKYLYSRELKMYQRADGIIFSMAGGKDYLKDRAWDKLIDLDKVHHINNGVDLVAFNHHKEQYQLDDLDLNDPNIFKVIYCGSIRKVNQVGKLLDVANLLKNEKVKFLIYGSGDELDTLKERVTNEQINNVRLNGFVDKKYIPYITTKSDVNIILGETSKLFSYGISMNKLFDYFASGKPTILSFKTNYSIVKEYQAGIELDDSNPELIVKAILDFMKMKDSEYQIYCQNALKAAKDYDYQSLTKQLLNIINN